MHTPGADVVSAIPLKELLEAAANAAGYVVTFRPNDILISIDGGAAEWWNPLADDGDALRLAVRLRLTINNTGDGVVCVYDNSDEEREFIEPIGSDASAATRLCIVRAAAEIGKGGVTPNVTVQAPGAAGL